MPNYKMMYDIMLNATTDAITLIEDGHLMDGLLLLTNAQLYTMDMEHMNGSDKME